jgi:sulfite dehydrogenase (cytochrome) subunit B
MKSTMLCLMLLAPLSRALGIEKTIKLPDDNAMAQLKPGQGVDMARKDCAACHSTDYIVRQPGRDAQQWQSEVSKMITVYGARISDSDGKLIVSYLASAYGPKQQGGSQKSEAGKRTEGKR